MDDTLAITDYFPGTSLNTTKWNYTYGTVGVDSNRMFIEATGGYSGAEAYSYPFTGRRHFAKVTVPTYSGGGREFFFELVNGLAGGNIIGFFWSGSSSTLFMRSTVGGTNSFQTIGYNPTTMAWLQLREAAGTFYWETSPDGVVWTTRRTVAHSQNTSEFYLSNSAGDYLNEGFGSRLYIENVNISAVPGRLKAHTGTEWKAVVPKVHDGTHWRPAAAKYHNGTAWEA